MTNKLETINTYRRPTKWTTLEYQEGKPYLVKRYQCPTCRYLFQVAPRCPECGQLVDSRQFKYGKVHKANRTPVEA